LITTTKKSITNPIDFYSIEWPNEFYTSNSLHQKSTGPPSTDTFETLPITREVINSEKSSDLTQHSTHAPVDTTAEKIKNTIQNIRNIIPSLFSTSTKFTEPTDTSIDDNTDLKISLTHPTQSTAFKKTESLIVTAEISISEFPISKESTEQSSHISADTTAEQIENTIQNTQNMFPSSTESTDTSINDNTEIRISFTHTTQSTAFKKNKDLIVTADNFTPEFSISQELNSTVFVLLNNTNELSYDVTRPSTHFSEDNIVESFEKSIQKTQNSFYPVSSNSFPPPSSHSPLHSHSQSPSHTPSYSHSSFPDSTPTFSISSTLESTLTSINDDQDQKLPHSFADTTYNIQSSTFMTNDDQIQTSSASTSTISPTTTLLSSTISNELNNITKFNLLNDTTEPIYEKNDTTTLFFESSTSKISTATETEIEIVQETTSTTIKTLLTSMSSTTLTTTLESSTNVLSINSDISLPFASSIFTSTNSMSPNSTVTESTTLFSTSTVIASSTAVLTITSTSPSIYTSDMLVITSLVTNNLVTTTLLSTTSTATSLSIESTTSRSTDRSTKMPNSTTTSTTNIPSAENINYFDNNFLFNLVSTILFLHIKYAQNELNFKFYLLK
jgi:hypothetical protein